MRNTISIFELMGPQAQYKVRVNHVEGLQHISFYINLPQALVQSDP